MKKYFLKRGHALLLSIILLANSFNSSAIPAGVTIDAEEIIRDIITVVGLKPNFAVKAANISSAAAVTYNGKRYIAYNPVFISNLNTKAGNKWASVSILAHEIGHHLNGHTLLNGGSQPNLELEADEFSGFVLKKMGATLAQAQVAMQLAADYKPGLTHPGQRDRLSAIARGWEKASSSFADMAKYNKPSPPTILAPAGRQSTQVRVPLTVPQNKPVPDSRFIIAHVNFPSDPNSSYYVTNHFNLVKVVNNKVFILGKLMATDSAQYPFVMKNKAGTLFIDRKGRILTPDKEFAGYLTSA